MRVLVSAELEPFLETTPPEGDVAVDLLPRHAPIPAGEWTGLVPLVSRAVSAADLAGLPRLRVVANYGVGVDNIDVDAAREREIEVTNTPDVLTDATAELTWALILAAARRLHEGEALARSGEWTGWHPTQLLGMGLTGRRLGIVGAGRIGREVGRRAGAFGMDVAYWNRTPRPAWEAETGAVRMELDALLEACDVVSLHAALAPETEGLLDAGRLARMRPGSILVNTARGGMVDEDALIGALASGRIRAAGLDVFREEPRIPERLRRLKNVVLLPHLGSATEQARRAMWDIAWRNLLRGVRGEDPITPV